MCVTEMETVYNDSVGTIDKLDLQKRLLVLLPLILEGQPVTI